MTDTKEHKIVELIKNSSKDLPTQCLQTFTDELNSSDARSYMIGDCSCKSTTELPTKELMLFINTYINLYGIENFIEMFPRSGILSHTISSQGNINGYVQTVTYDNPKCRMCSRQKLYKDSTYFTWENTRTIDVRDSTMMLVNWPGQTDIKNIASFLQNNYKILVLMILDYQVDTDIISRIKSCGYVHNTFNIKRVAWKKKHDDVHIFVRGNRFIPDMKSQLDHTIFSTERKTSNATLTSVMEDLISQKKLPSWTSSDSQINNISDMYINIFSTVCDHPERKDSKGQAPLCCNVKKYNQTIPIWLKNYKEVEFWYECVKKNNIPSVLLTDEEKFGLYYTSITKFRNYALNKYRTTSKFPDYITTSEEGEKYLLLQSLDIGEDWYETYDSFVNAYKSYCK